MVSVTGTFTEDTLGADDEIWTDPLYVPGPPTFEGSTLTLI
jgi:hypothetical protein